MWQPDQFDEAQLLETALADFARVTGLPMVFGGYNREGTAIVTALNGNRTPSLRELRVETGRGLGGRALLEARPRFTADYERSKQITHDYDREIMTEGIRSLVVVPVVVGSDVRAILYGGAYGQTPLAPVIQRPVAEVANEFARELRIRDDVAKRSELVAEASRSREIPAPMLEELRSSYAELRSLANSVEDPGLRAKLEAVELRLAKLSGAPGSTGTLANSSIKLSPRETDVLSHVALGRTNAEVGRALGLTESTVKAYMKSAASKLGCSNRHAAVATARREGLIP